jgi:hypothetical protein
LFRTAAEFSVVVAWLLERWTDAHRDAPTFFGPFVTTTPVISISSPPSHLRSHLLFWFSSVCANRLIFPEILLIDVCDFMCFTPVWTLIGYLVLIILLELDFGISVITCIV